MSEMDSGEKRGMFTQTTVFRLSEADRQQLSQPEPQVQEEQRIDWGALGDSSHFRLYQEFVEGIYDAVIICTGRGWIADSNERACEFFGFDKRHLRGLRITDIVHGFDPSIFRQLVNDVRDGVRVIVEAYCVRRDRSVFPSEITVNQIHIGTVPHLCFLIRNITRRVDAEIALRESERRFRDISESMSDWIWEVDTAGAYTYLTEAATRVMGYPVEAMLGRSMFHHTTLEHRALAQRQYSEVVAAAGNFQGLEVWLETGSGEWRCIAFCGCPVFDDSGALAGFRGIASDVTDTRTKDAELERHRNHLEELVQQRTEELSIANTLLTNEVGVRKKAESGLRDAVTKLERSNAELQQFAYVVSHDLKEPLRMIASYCQLLQRRYREQLPEDAQEFIAFAVDGAERMQHMIDDLLAYSRLSTRERNSDTCDLDVILQQVRRNLKVATEETRATIDAESLPAVRGDRTQLLLLFQNLLSNAFKFRRPDEAPRIHISWEPLAEDAAEPGGEKRRMVRIRVADRGVGIPEESLDDVFMIFHRLHHHRALQGTGIGLAICRKIVANHGGTIMAENNDDGGATFSFTLPLAEDK